MADPFLSPRCTPGQLATWIARRGVLQGLKQNLSSFSGTLVDIGCGRMPYRALLTSSPSSVTRYIGVDIPNPRYQDEVAPDLEWDGKRIPLRDGVAGSVMATEVLEHCPDPGVVLSEAYRIAGDGAFALFTVPFLWPLHDVPQDEYRFTPFSLRRHIEGAGFGDVAVSAVGGWDASLAQMIGLWASRRPMPRALRRLLLPLATPFVAALARMDEPPTEFGESLMVTGLVATASKGSHWAAT
jgi:hypothetical protein